MLVTLLSTVDPVSFLTWSGLSVWCSPGMWRVLRKRPRYWDPLRAMLWMLMVNRLWYSGRPLIFGRHAEVMSQPEIAWLLATALVSFACAAVIIIVVRGYERLR